MPFEDVRRGVCEHSALLHRGDADLSRRLHPTLHRAAGEAGAVLMCLDEPTEARIRADFGSVCDGFTFAPADGRYSTPGMAMAALDRFVASAMGSGASSAWSIGAIPLRGDGRDARWIRYEEAVDAIFADRPLRAVCLYDAAATPAEVRDGVRRTHHSLDGEWAIREVGSGSDDGPSSPARAADLVIRDPSPRAARNAIASCFEHDWPHAALHTLLLVTSELVTNALLHGAPPVLMEAWRETDGCTLRVIDRGSGSITPYADLRPAVGGPDGGFGLWTIGQLADSVEITRQDDTTIVSVFVAAR